GEQQAYLSAGPEYREAILFHHNHIRSNHNAPPLTWNDSAAADALKSAQRCIWQHWWPHDANEKANPKGFGQNIATTSSPYPNVTADIVDMWYKSEFVNMTQSAQWGLDNIDATLFEAVGHLTQLVWKDTTSVGCASWDCNKNMRFKDHPQGSDMDKFFVCNYYPAGNMGGQYATNVLQPKEWDVSKFRYDD
ncbi:CAP domain-containing protein, partial [Lophiotrema nucula]